MVPWLGTLTLDMTVLGYFWNMDFISQQVQWSTLDNCLKNHLQTHWTAHSVSIKANVEFICYVHYHWEWITCLPSHCYHVCPPHPYNTYLYPFSPTTPWTLQLSGHMLGVAVTTSTAAVCWYYWLNVFTYLCFTAKYWALFCVLCSL